MRRKRLVILVFILLTGLLSGCAAAETAPTQTAEPTEIPPDASSIPTQTDVASYFETKIEQPIPVIFSHDGAPDDITTLVYIAKHPQVDLLGVIQSYGEQHPAESLEEWQVFLYDVLDEDDVPIGLGSEETVDPAQNEFPASWRTGADNFWGLPLPSASEEYSHDKGADLIIRLVKDSPEKVVMLVTGAQTDMALALQKDPSIAENISQIVIMGGAFNRGGNLHEFPGYENNQAAEWNIYVDPLAAKEVFNSGIPLSIVSLDGSDDFLIGREDYDKITSSDDPALQLLARLWENNFRSWNGDFKIWDIVAGVAMTDPEHFTWTYDGVDVIVQQGDTHGQTIRLNNVAKHTRFTAITSYVRVRESIFEVLK